MQLPFWLKKLFSKTASSHVSLRDVAVGQLVEVKFHDPRKLGIQAPNGQLTCTRFNPSEFDNRVIKGFILNIGKWDGGPNFGRYIEIDARSSELEQRRFLLLEHEIDTMRVLE